MTKNKTILAFDEALKRHGNLQQNVFCGVKPLIKFSTFIKLFIAVICVVGAWSGEISEVTAGVAVLAFILQRFEKTKPVWGFMLLGLLFNAILGIVSWVAFLLAAAMGFTLIVDGKEV